ncbi:hypothetical protein QFZ43_007478 [Streptomyces afghaniensis]|nr:hypothetical protein [Streptomyces afghaniensis]
MSPAPGSRGRALTLLRAAARPSKSCAVNDLRFGSVVLARRWKVERMVGCRVSARARRNARGHKHPPQHFEAHLNWGRTAVMTRRLTRKCPSYPGS